MKIKKILVIGLGNIGLRHAKILKKLLPNAEIKVMHHKRKIKKLKINYNTVNSIKEAIKYSPNLVVISNPTSVHLKSAMIFSDIKTNIFIEKPLSHNLLNINKFINKVNKNKLFLAVGYNLRYLPSLIFFKKLIDKKFVGNIYHFHSSVGHYLPEWRNNINYKKVVSANKKLGGGVLLELSHEIDYINWLFGKINFVYAKITKQSNLKINVEDFCNMIFSINSKNKTIIGSLIMDFLRRDKSRECTLVAEKGTLTWNGDKGKVKYFNPKNNKWKNLFTSKNEMDTSYVNQWKDIIKRIENNKKPNINIFDGIRALEVIESARISEIKNKEIMINYKYKK